MLFWSWVPQQTGGIWCLSGGRLPVLTANNQLLLHIHVLNAKCMHPGLPFQGANILYMFMSLEEVLQNEAVGMNFSVDNQYQFYRLHPR